MHSHKARNVAIMVFVMMLILDWIRMDRRTMRFVLHYHPLSTHCTKLGGTGVLIYYVKSPYVCVEICQIFTYMKKWGSKFSNFIFQIFNNWGISVQSTPWVVHSNQWLGQEFSTILTNINKISFFFFFQLNLLWIILCPTSIVGTISCT